ncbi:hypothetical protein EI982_14480 [Haloplanus rallus]|uniref:Uncharacterized protein n=1 Tax=Haloplanus rallus TaxID=1816183 RepID=A0A6B9FB68_9EURY|nr:MULTISPECIES: hypothetical protein [Haloplanus]QGX95904.1 hypothetical protein EI982_14480 [Haloplanus rallus]
MDRRRVALLLLVVGMLCLPAPQYLGWAAEATSPPERTAQVYAAEPIDLANESDRTRFVDRYGHEVAVADYQLTTRYGDEYRAPDATRRTLETAMANGSATAPDERVRADLRAIDDEYAFVRDSDAGTEGYYRLTVEGDGSTVAADPVPLSVVADATAERAPRYETLSAAERRTVDAVLNEGEYRPRVNDPYVDRLPTAIRKDGTLYSIHVVGHVDDFGPGFAGFVVGLGVAALGVVLLLAGGGLYAYDRWLG